MKSGRDCGLLILVAVLLMGVCFPAGADNMDLESAALQINLFDSRESIEALIEIVKLNDSNLEGRSDENSLLYTSNLKDSSRTFALFGEFDQHDTLQKLIMQWMKFPIEDSKVFLDSLLNIIKQQFGEPFRDLDDTTYREEPGGDINFTERLISWKSNQDDLQIYIHLKLQESTNDNRSIILLYSVNDFVLPDKSANDTIQTQSDKSGKSLGLKGLYSSFNLFFSETGFTSYGAVYFFFEALAIDKDWLKKSDAEDEEAYLVKHDLGYSMYWFTKNAGFSEVHYNAELDLVTLIEHGPYISAAQAITESYINGRISEYREVDMDDYWKILLSLN